MIRTANSIYAWTLLEAASRRQKWVSGKVTAGRQNTPPSFFAPRRWACKRMRQLPSPDLSRSDAASTSSTLNQGRLSQRQNSESSSTPPMSLQAFPTNAETTKWQSLVGFSPMKARLRDFESAHLGVDVSRTDDHLTHYLFLRSEHRPNLENYKLSNVEKYWTRIWTEMLTSAPVRLKFVRVDRLSNSAFKSTSNASVVPFAFLSHLTSALLDVVDVLFPVHTSLSTTISKLICSTLITK